MAVDIEDPGTVQAGDSLRVTLADGTVTDGTAAAVADGILTVTISDKEGAYGEEVQVSDDSGEHAGSVSVYTWQDGSWHCGTVTDLKAGDLVVFAYYEKNGQLLWIVKGRDELGGLTEVETGAADGTNVEIISGLEEGSTVYYRYADSIQYTFLSAS